MARSCSCDDFTRAQLLRRGVAQAGRGLPSVEPGQPVPAGSGMDRRSFLLRSAGAVLSVYGAAALAPHQFEQGILQAAAAAPPNQPVLVSIFIEGGWDALSVLAPERLRIPTFNIALSFTPTGIESVRVTAEVPGFVASTSRIGVFR